MARAPAEPPGIHPGIGAKQAQLGGPLRIHVRRGPRRPAHHGPAKLAIPIDRTFTLDEAEAAQARMRTNAHFGKIVMVVG